MPLPQNLLAFGRMFELYLELMDRGTRLSNRAQNLYDSLLRWLFAEAGEPLYLGGPEEPETIRARLAPPMEQFLKQMSRFQQELYQTLVMSGGGQPVHTLLKQMGTGQARAAGIQDALSTMALLEQFGFVERESPRKIPALPGEMDSSAQERQYVIDHNGRPVCIDTYSPVKDLSEENKDAAGAGEDSEL